MSQPDQEGDQLPDDEFVQLVQRFQDAVQAGRVDEADALSLNLMGLAAQHAMAHPTPEMEIQAEAQRCEAAADWQGAENAYRKLLDRADSSGEAMQRYNGLSALCGLNQLLGRSAVALEKAETATAAARATELTTLLAMALEQQARCALRLGRVSEAAAALDEALRSMGQEKMYDVQRGRCLVHRAECALGSDDLGGADASLEAAHRCLEPQSRMEWAAGVHAGVARWWAVKARLLSAQGDVSGAANAWAKAVAGRRHVAELPHAGGVYTQNALAEALAEQGRFLLTTGRAPEAEEALAETRSIRERLGLPPTK
jgi:tetratricopeptide (TPR) repeat protein